MTLSRPATPIDQAHGLRRMFAAADGVIVPVVANPHVEYHGALLARLAGVFAERGLNTLVVDTADTAPEAGDLADVDLGACVEPLSPQLAYLGARGLPLRHVDTHGSCAGFLPHVMRAVADVTVLVLHAEARVLARLLGRRELRPVLLASAQGESVTHAYAALKLLVTRLQLMSFDLLLPDIRGQVPRPQHVADRLADCADRFLGAALHDSAAVDPTIPFDVAANPELVRLALAQIDLTALPAAATALASWPAPHRATTPSPANLSA